MIEFKTKKYKKLLINALSGLGVDLGDRLRGKEFTLNYEIKESCNYLNGVVGLVSVTRNGFFMYFEVGVEIDEVLVNQIVFKEEGWFLKKKTNIHSSPVYIKIKKLSFVDS